MVRAPVGYRNMKKDKALPDEVSEAILDIGGLERLSSNIPSPSVLDRQMKTHHALSDKTRLKIIWSIRCCDLCPCVLKEFLKISDSKLSYHLSVLEKAGLVSSCQEKNWRIYSITVFGREVLGCNTIRKKGTRRRD